MAAKDVLGGGGWDGTKATGFVTVKQNKPPRQCNNCRFYKQDSCHEEHVKADKEIKRKRNPDGSVPVKDDECCNFMKNKKARNG